MLEKPNLDDTRLIAQLSEEYGLRAADLSFLPLGADTGTAVYRVVADDARAYFLKLRGGPFDEMTVAVPSFLSSQGIRQIIAPLTTPAGRLWSTLDDFTLTLYPFLAGDDGYAGPLSEPHWVELGAALKRIHTAPLTAALSRALPRETYSPHWRQQVRAFQSQLRGGRYPDPVAAELAAFMNANAAAVHELVSAADQLSQSLQGRTPESILCHADLHAGNLLIAQNGSLFIVDWDTALLAPKERDLMFVGSGLGPAWDQPQTAAWFYQGYGPADPDLTALAYYRCERIVQDIATYCDQILSTTENGPDRAQGLLYLMSSFQPNGVVDIALASCRAVQAPNDL
jgi:spectinomycin phosphotransferase